MILESSDEYVDEYDRLIPTTDFIEGILIANPSHERTADPDAYDDTPDESVVLDLINEFIEFAPELEAPAFAVSTVTSIRAHPITILLLTSICLMIVIFGVVFRITDSNTVQP